jgi:type I restriction enzyme R subunit
MPTPEQQARSRIDALLEAAGWSVQDAGAANIHAARGVAIREFPLSSPSPRTRGEGGGEGLSTDGGYADYLLYVDGKAAGVIEAKKEGATLAGVEIQSARYAHGLPAGLPAWRRPLPFLYESTGVETRFSNRLDPEPLALRIRVPPSRYPSRVVRSADIRLHSAVAIL